MPDTPTADEIARAVAEQLLGPRPAKQLTRDDLRSMTPDEIVAAHRAGQLDDLITPKRPELPPQEED